MNMKYECI